MREKTLYELFRLTILVKAFFAVADILGAFLLYVFGFTVTSKALVLIAQGELLQDSGDLLARFFLHNAERFSPDITTFAIAYLLIHGLVNVVFLIGLWRDKRWAYLFAIVALSVFLVYQLHRLYLSFSFGLMALSIFDLCVIGLIWHEYHYRKVDNTSAIIAP